MPVKIRQYLKIWQLAVMLLLISCSPTRHLSEGQYLVDGNRIVFVDEETEEIDPISKQEKSRLTPELMALSIQQPNKKFLFIFRPRLAFYNAVSSPGKEEKRLKKGKTEPGKFSTWIRDKVGEAPVLLDSGLAVSSQDRMRIFMVNQGYFNAEVYGGYQITGKKKAGLEYTVTAGSRYLFNNYIPEIEDTVLAELVLRDLHLTHIKKGEPYTTDALKLEQERISNALNNQGYFSFARKYVNFEIDTSGPDLAKDVYLIIKNEESESAHRTYQIGEVTFNINYANSGLKRKRIEADTLRNLYLFYSRHDIRPDIIARSIFYQPDSTFKKDDYQKTVSRLSDLGIFRFVNIKYKPLMVSETEGYIDTEIVAELRKRQSGKIELETNTDARDRIGTFVNFSYTNRNILRRADRLQINVSNGVEFRFNNVVTDGQRDQRLNTLNFIVNGRLYFPSIFPKTNKGIEKTGYKPVEFSRSTFINTSYNLQQRLGFFAFAINTFSIGYGYDIRGKRTRHEFQPFNLSFIKPREQSFNANFEQFLQQNPIFALSYRQQFIMAQEYIFSYSSQSVLIGNVKSFFYYRGVLNTAGNLVYGLQSLISDQRPAEGFTALGVPYASFTKIDNDFRYYFNFRNNSALVFRAFIGTGIPYGNSNIMPFIKQYAAGGPQSMRGWNYRQLGPGSADTSVTTPDLNTGDLQLEGNVEFRFSLSNIFKAALFTDIGNVWLMRADSSLPNANFEFRRLGQDLAWSAGFGFRLDFGLFVIRLDHSYKIYNPNGRPGSRWVTQYPGFEAVNLPESEGGPKDNIWQRRKSWSQRYANFVIGIGYPF
jgi:outer membrane protein insertion porin family